MECLLGDNEKTLQQPFVTGAPGGWDSFNEKMNGKLSKNVWQFTKHNCENGSKMTQKKVLKESPLGGNGKTLQKLCVTVTPEERESFTKRMNKR